MQTSILQTFLNRAIAKHDAARAKADELMTANSSSRHEAQELAYWRGYQNATNEAACTLKCILEAEKLWHKEVTQ